MKLCNAAGEKVKGLDKFGQSFNFGLGPSGETEIKSFCGATLTIFVSVVMLVYTVYKIDFLIERQGAQIVQTFREKHFS